MKTRRRGRGWGRRNIEEGEWKEEEIGKEEEGLQGRGVLGYKEGQGSREWRRRWIRRNGEGKEKVKEQGKMVNGEETKCVKVGKGVKRKMIK